METWWRLNPLLSLTSLIWRKPPLPVVLYILWFFFIVPWSFPIPRNAISILLRTGVIISDNNDNIRTWVGYTRNGTNALLFVFPIQKDCDEFLENYITLYALLMVFSRRDTGKRMIVEPNPNVIDFHQHNRSFRCYFSSAYKVGREMAPSLIIPRLLMDRF